MASMQRGISTGTGNTTQTGLNAWESRSGPIWVGLGEETIAPDWKVVLPYGKRVETDVFYNKNIFVAAVVFKVADLEVALVEIDYIGAWWPQAQVIRARIAVEAGIPPERIILGAIHNHSYPRPNDPRVLDFVAEQSAKAVKKARSSMFRAMIGATERTMPEALSINRSWVGGAVNSDLYVVRIDDPAGHARAVVVNCGIHPTCFTTSWGDGRVGMIGPEWPEYVRRQVSFHQASHFDYMRRDANVPHQESFTMFTLGAAGDQQAALWLDEIDGGRVSPLKAFADTLAREVINTVDWVRTEPEAEMSFRARQLEVAVGPWEGPVRRRETLVQVLGVNDTAFVAVPGELVYGLGKEIGRLSPYKHTVPVTIANDFLGYIVSEAEARESVTYESKSCSFRPELGPSIVESIAGLLQPGFCGRTGASLPEGLKFGAVAGTVKGGGGRKLVVGAMNKIEGPSSNPPFWGKRAMVAPDGTYRLEELLPGSKFLYVVEVAQDYDGQAERDVRIVTYGVPVEVSAGKTVEVDFGFPPNLYATGVKSIRIETVFVEPARKASAGVAGGEGARREVAGPESRTGTNRTGISGPSPDQAGESGGKAEEFLVLPPSPGAGETRRIRGRVLVEGSLGLGEKIEGRVYLPGVVRQMRVSGNQRQSAYLDHFVAACVVGDAGEFCFEGVVPGTYVLGFWLDVNGNGIVEPGVDVLSPLSEPVRAD